MFAALVTIALVLFVGCPVLVALVRGRAAVKRIRETAAWALDDDLLVLPSEAPLDLSSLRSGETTLFVPPQSEESDNV